MTICTGGCTYREMSRVGAHFAVRRIARTRMPQLRAPVPAEPAPPPTIDKEKRRS